MNAKTRFNNIYAYIAYTSAIISIILTILTNTILTLTLLTIITIVILIIITFIFFELALNYEVNENVKLIKNNKVTFDTDKLKQIINDKIESKKELLVPLDFFEKSEIIMDDETLAKQKANKIKTTLEKFKISVQFEKFLANATTTTLMFSGKDFIEKETGRITPFDNARLSNFVSNIRLALGTQFVNYIPLIEGESLFAFEIKSDSSNVIKFGNIIEYVDIDPLALNYIVGQRTDGSLLKTNMIDHPHSFIVGTTGSGKSTFANSMLAQLIATKTSAELNLWISDNKVVEFSAFENLPHTKFFAKSYQETLTMLQKLNQIQEHRTSELFRSVNAKNILVYNKKVSPEKRLPFIVVLIDEYPTLAETDSKTRGKPFSSELNMLLSKSRAAGIYVNIISQNAKATTIDTTLRSNLQCRIVLAVADSNESDTAGVKGAELLNGNGDLIFKLNQFQERAQAPLISDDEISKMIDYIIHINSKT